MAVYFIQAGENGPVKIGVAKHVQRRMAFLQTGNHERLSLIREVPGDRYEESLYHQHFGNLRLHHEWFTYCPTMLTFAVTVSAVKGKRFGVDRNQRYFSPLEVQLLADIEAFLARHAMGESTFGHLAINDAIFMNEFRRKRVPRLSTAERLYAFMSSYALPDVAA